MKTHDSPVAMLREKLLMRITPEGKAQHRWVYGVWVGRSLRNDEHMITTEDVGLVRNRSAKHLAISEAWGPQAKKMLLNLTWTPWEQMPEHRRAGRPPVDAPDFPEGRPADVKDPPAAYEEVPRLLLWAEEV